MLELDWVPSFVFIVLEFRFLNNLFNFKVNVFVFVWVLLNSCGNMIRKFLFLRFLNVGHFRKLFPNWFWRLIDGWIIRSFFDFRILRQNFIFRILLGKRQLTFEIAFFWDWFHLFCFFQSCFDYFHFLVCGFEHNREVTVWIGCDVFSCRSVIHHVQILFKAMAGLIDVDNDVNFWIFDKIFDQSLSQFWLSVRNNSFQWWSWPFFKNFDAFLQRQETFVDGNCLLEHFLGFYLVKTLCFTCSLTSC